MKKIVSITLFIIVLMSSACAKAQSNAASQGIAAEEIKNPGSSLFLDKDKWLKVQGVETNYVKLEDIEPDKVPEIKLSINTDLYNSAVAEYNNGLMFGHMEEKKIVMFGQMLKKGDSSNAPKKRPEINKIDKDGKIIFKTFFEYEYSNGRVKDVLVFPDESFAFSVESYPFYIEGTAFYEKSSIIKCDKIGKVLWKRDFENYSGEVLKKMFLTDKNEIIAVGQWNSENGKQVKQGFPSDIVITKLDKDGNVIVQKSFGGSDFDDINSVKYDKPAGIVINGRTQSKDGPFAIKSGRSSSDFIACIDVDMKIKWVDMAKDDEYLVFDQLAVKDGNIYVPGQLAKANGWFVIKYNKEGKRLWKNQQNYKDLWIRTVEVLENGNVCVGFGQQNKGAIIILDSDGNEKKKVEDLKSSIDNIKATKDGGFIATSIRNIKTIPQPPVISSIWYDTETVAVKYDSSCSIQWRKTYDRYKEEMKIDFVYPLSNGKLLVP